MNDIEKLIKKKIEVEPFALEGERRERHNDGHRTERAERGDRGERRREGRGGGEADGDRRERYRPAPVSRDPFFDKPYEPSAADAPAAWDATAKPAGARRFGQHQVAPQGGRAVQAGATLIVK